MKAATFGWAITLLAAWHLAGLATPLAAQNSSFPPPRPTSPTAGGLRPAPPGTPPGAAPMAEPRAESQPVLLDDGLITIQLHDGSRMRGKPVGFSEVRMKTEFGEVTIPIAKIEGIRVSNDYGKQGLGVLLANGDLLHGSVGLDTFKLETSFGEVAISWQRLESIVMSPEWKTWVPEGRSWRLVPTAEIERRVVQTISQPQAPRIIMSTPTATIVAPPGYPAPATTGTYATPGYAPATYAPYAPATYAPYAPSYNTTPPAPVHDPLPLPATVPDADASSSSSSLPSTY